jgi:arabinan endo-1,5-alpha-L-arabinosidase
VDIEMKSDGTVSGAVTGTWSIEEGTSYVTIRLGTALFSGVMIEQTLEPTDIKTPSFTALCTATGVTIWGYQTEASTGIADIVADPVQKDGTVYDLNGRRICHSQNPGIYIRNGKKYIIR